MNETTRPQLVQPREMTRTGSRDNLLNKVIENTAQGGFDAEVFHVMNKRDDSLIEDEILNGSQSSKFLYVMEGMKGEDGKPVSGISVIGARHLAATYGGLKHRIVASVRKVGSQVINTSYPQPGVPMATHVQSIPEIEGEPDSYTVIIEITDVKKGNSLMVEKTEERYGRRRDGSAFERPNYQIIAQSKAFRNGTLSIVPQDVLIKWKLDLLKLDKHKDLITDGVRDEKLSGLMAFATKNSLPIDRQQSEELTMSQISGLQAAAVLGLPSFVNAAINLGLLAAAEDAEETKAKTTAKAPANTRKPAATQGGMPETDPGDPGPGDTRGTTKAEAPHDPETGEVKRTAPTKGSSKEFF